MLPLEKDIEILFEVKSIVCTLVETEYKGEGAYRQADMAFTGTYP